MCDAVMYRHKQNKQLISLESRLAPNPTLASCQTHQALLDRPTDLGLRLDAQVCVCVYVCMYACWRKKAHEPGLITSDLQCPSHHPTSHELQSKLVKGLYRGFYKGARKELLRVILGV